MFEEISKRFLWQRWESQVQKNHKKIHIQYSKKSEY